MSPSNHPNHPQRPSGSGPRTGSDGGSGVGNEGEVEGQKGPQWDAEITPFAPHRRGREVWAFANQKGGCGKTTTAVNLAGALVAAGQRVLLVDNDPQAHASLALGHAAERGDCLGAALSGDRSLDDVLVDVRPGLVLAPASLGLGDFELDAGRRPGAEGRLAACLAELDREFDWVLVDCPPRADGLLTANALVAATTLLLVVETGAFSLQGALRARQLLEGKAGDLGLNLDLRVLATMFNRRTRFAREVLVGMQARFGVLMFDTAIRESVRLREAAGYGMPVEDLDPSSRAAAEFRALAGELLRYTRHRRGSDEREAEAEATSEGTGEGAKPAAPSEGQTAGDSVALDPATGLDLPQRRVSRG